MVVNGVDLSVTVNRLLSRSALCQCIDKDFPLLFLNKLGIVRLPDPECHLPGRETQFFFCSRHILLHLIWDQTLGMWHSNQRDLEDHSKNNRILQHRLIFVIAKVFDMPDSRRPSTSPAPSFLTILLVRKCLLSRTPLHHLIKIIIYDLPLPPGLVGVLYHIANVVL